MVYYSDCISWQVFRDFVFVINEKNKKMYTLKDTNKWFWLAIQKEHNLVNIASELYSKVSGVDFKTIYDDLVDLTFNLQEEGLLVLKGKEVEHNA